MSEIKASEILLNLDNRMKNMEKQLKLQEFQLRIIIDNFNKFYKNTQQKLPETVIPEPVEAKIVESDKDYDFKSEVREGKKEEKKEKKKVAVTQLLKFNNGDPLVGANVLIHNASKVLLKKVTTNTVGRWQAFLTPQKYLITVIGSNSNAEDVEFDQTIIIPESDVPFTVPSPKIN